MADLIEKGGEMVAVSEGGGKVRKPGCIALAGKNQGGLKAGVWTLIRVGGDNGFKSEL